MIDYVAVLARNPYDFPVKVNRSPSVLLLDGAGEVVYRSRLQRYDDATFLGQIPPGGIVGLEFCTCEGYYSGVPEWETFQLDFDLAEVPPVVLSTDFDIGLSEHGYCALYDWFTEVWVGSSPRGMDTLVAPLNVRYRGQQTLKSAYVRLIIRDQAGEFVSAGGVRIARSGGIHPGDALSVDLAFLLEEPLYTQAIQACGLPSSLKFEFSGLGVVAEP